MNLNIENASKAKKEMDPQEARFRRRKDIIKNIAIIFLVIMLVLTFFSNTIMNYSLVQVAVQYVTSGTITNTIRGTGTVASGDPYNVMIKETRTVSSINCRVGDKVQEGDLLISLSGNDSAELEAAKDELEAAQKAYDDILLSADMTATLIANSQANVSVNTYRTQITNAQNAVDTAQKAVDTAQSAVDAAQAKVNSINAQINIANSSYVSEADKTSLTNAQAAYNLAKDDWENLMYSGDVTSDYNDAKSNLDDAQSQLDNTTTALATATNATADAQSKLDSITDITSNEYTEAKKALDNAKAAQAIAQTAYDNAKASYDTEKSAYDSIASAYNKYSAYINAKATYDKLSESITNQENSNSDTVSSLRAQLAAAENELTTANNNKNSAQEKLDEKTEELGELIGDISLARSLNSARDAVSEAQKKVDGLTETSAAMDVKAPINGTVISINVQSGKETDPSYAAVILQPEGQGYTMSFTLTNDEAKTISVGDVATVANSWWYNDVAGSVASIKPDTTSPNTSKQVTLNLEGTLTEGQSLTMTIDTRTNNYDCLVPNSALHEDNNGKFVLIVESKSSPLGNRYFAVRYDVEVLASDDTKSAINGGLTGYEYVITTSSKPISAGDQVRLNES